MACVAVLAWAWVEEVAADKMKLQVQAAVAGAAPFPARQYDCAEKSHPAGEHSDYTWVSPA